MVNKADVTFCLDADTGQKVWHGRLKGQFWTSPIGCDDRIYFFGVDGLTEVVKVTDSFERIAANRLSVEGRMYGVIPVDNGLLVRYGRRLVRIGQV